MKKKGIIALALTAALAKQQFQVRHEWLNWD